MRLLSGLFVLTLLSLSAPRAEDPPIKQAIQPVRVLLMAHAAGREYQFLRAALQRPVEGRKFVCTQLIQSVGEKGQNVVERGDERILTVFPDHLRKVEDDAPAQVPFNLASYDVIVGFDPDWMALTPEQQELLKKWLENGGALIVLAGEVQTPKLASPVLRGPLKIIRELYPVEVADVRLRMLDPKAALQPQRVTFTEAGAKVAALRLDPANLERGWTTFHGPADKDAERGFYRAYAIDKVKPGAETLATVGKDVPYLVSSKVGKGQVLYIGSEEFWRIRQVRHEWYESLWCGLIQHVSGARAGK